MSAQHDSRLGPAWGSLLHILPSLCLLAAAVANFALAPAAWAQATGSAAAHTVLVLDVKDAIGPATTEYLGHGLEAAAARNADAVVIRIDTPGGLVSSTRDIIQAILASPVPVIAYVAPGGARAASAGTYIVYACQLAAMAPGTNIGAATVVSMGAPPGSGRDRSPAPKQPGERREPARPDSGKPAEPPADEAPGHPASEDASMRKAINDAAAFIRSLADLHGRNAEWAEKAVRDGVSIPAQEALRDKVVEIVAPDLRDVLAQADGRVVNVQGRQVTLATRDAAVTTLEPDWRTRFLGVITNPDIAYILMLLGVYGIIFELMTPGVVLPGVLGAVSLVTGLFALNLLPVNYAGVGLVLLGIGLMAAEGFTGASGFLGVVGVAIFALGSLFMFDSAQAAFSLSVPVVATATAVVALLLAIVVTVAVRAHRRSSPAGDSTLVGHRAEVLFWSGAQGRVRLGDETWDARARRPFHPGDHVVVIARDGLTLSVDATDAAQREDAP
ncbi:NfeD family protein [Bordetella genomosp. 9]|uniref:Serine protease n=1 Tax=Bordetella genomosp. 9 TaxID=1416803 RepID=A0A1W6YVZ6_9BORD|nr:nodulation protein NfeD [Bordetella genomosp. 9]ARP85285.1 serine protease [Bordetella genomosp. 9]